MADSRSVSRYLDKPENRYFIPHKVPGPSLHEFLASHHYQEIDQ